MPRKDHHDDPSTESPHRVQGGWGAPTSVMGNEPPDAQPHGTTDDQIRDMESEGQAEKPGSAEAARQRDKLRDLDVFPEGSAPDQDEHEGATEDQVGDRSGPAVGYDEGAKHKNRH